MLPRRRPSRATAPPRTQPTLFGSSAPPRAGGSMPSSSTATAASPLPSSSGTSDGWHAVPRPGPGQPLSVPGEELSKLLLFMEARTDMGLLGLITKAATARIFHRSTGRSEADRAGDRG